MTTSLRKFSEFIVNHIIQQYLLHPTMLAKHPLALDIFLDKPMLLPEGYKIMQLPPYPDMIADQRLFQNTFGHGDLPYPQIPPTNVRERRYKLVNEEMYHEFDNAHQAIEDLASLHPDDPARQELEPSTLAFMADAIADSIYVLIGTAFEYGIPIDKVWREVQRANMAKLWTSNEIISLLITPTDSALKPEYSGWSWKLGRAYPCSTNPPADAPEMDKRLAEDAKALHKAWIVYNEHGKVMKPPSFKAPDIEGIIREAIQAGKAAQATPPISPKEEVPTENQDTTDFPTKPCRICGKKDRPQYKGTCNDDHCSH